MLTILHEINLMIKIYVLSYYVNNSSQKFGPASFISNYFFTKILILKNYLAIITIILFPHIKLETVVNEFLSIKNVGLNIKE